MAETQLAEVARTLKDVATHPFVTAVGSAVLSSYVTAWYTRRKERRPKVVLECDENEDIEHKNWFIINIGSVDAFNVVLNADPQGDWRLDSDSVDRVSASDGRVPIGTRTVRLTGFGTDTYGDIEPFLRAAVTEKNQFNVSIPVRLSYTDFEKKCYSTKCEIVYHSVAQTVRCKLSA